MSNSKEEFESYLTDRYQKQVDWYDKKSVWNKKRNDKLQIAIIIVAAIIPAFAALEKMIITIVFSAIVSAGTGILKYGKYEELSHNYRTICETLKKEKYFYDFKISDYQNAIDPERLFIERVESLISEENIIWYSIVEKEKDKK